MARWFNFFNLPKTDDDELQAYSSGVFHRRRQHPRRKIRRSWDGNHDEGVLKDLPRFGPLYASDEEAVMKGLKKMAWELTLDKTGGDPEETTERYLSTVRQVEKQALEFYDHNQRKETEEESAEFRWMMLRDGCLFLQLTIMILGGSSLLESSEDHVVFGRDKRVEKQRWITSMFYVGNQIPLVVLTRLMKESFYHRIITQAKNLLPKPSSSSSYDSLYEEALYEFVLCANYNNKHDDYDSYNTPSNLLHGLQSLLVRKFVKGGNRFTEDAMVREDDEDLESGENEDEHEDKEAGFPSATELGKEGIEFQRTTKRAGETNEGVHFATHKFELWGVLYMPCFRILGEQTLLVLKNVMSYERIQYPKRKDRRPLCGYLKFMSELVPTREDAKILIAPGIVESHSQYRERLPKLLRELSEGETSSYLPDLRSQVNEYSQPNWWKYKGILSLAFFLTVVQTVFGILSYVHDITS